MENDIFRAIDPEFVKQRLSEKKDGFFPDCKGKEIEKIDIKRVSPEWAKETCLVRYTIGFGDGVEKVVRGTAKAKSSKVDVWETMVHLHANIDRSNNLSIPRPLEYMEDIGMLLYEEAPGTPLVMLLQSGSQKEKMDAMERCAEWLSWLHGVPVNNEKIPKAIFIGSSGYKKTLKEARENIPEIKDEVIPDGEVDFIDRIWSPVDSIIHNDFYPGNSVVGKKEFFGIDFDRAGYGPPLMDVAALYSFFDFSKSMWPHKMTDDEASELRRVFLEKYCLLNGLDPSETERRMHPFVVKSFLDQLHYYVAFFIRGREFMDDETKSGFSNIIGDILNKIKELTIEIK